MPVKRRVPKHRTTVSPVAWKILNDEPVSKEEGGFEALALNSFEGEARGTGPGLRDLWTDHHDEILSTWIASHPGTRPSLWWRWEAPETRRRLGGTGTAMHDALAYTPAYTKGIPDSWVADWEVNYYNGRQVDEDGEVIGNGYRDGDFLYEAVDPNDPPLFESEAAYLDRHGLLVAGEKKRLKPADFEPVSIEFADSAE